MLNGAMTKRAAGLLVGVLGSILLPASNAEQAPIELRFSGGPFRPLAGAPAAAVEMSPRNERYVVAITRGGLDPAERQRLVDAGAELLDYIPVHGYRIRIAPEAVEAVRALPFVLWLGEVPAHFKVEPGLVEEPLDETAVRVLVTAGEPVTRILGVLDKIEVTSAPSGKDGAWRVVAQLPAARLAETVSRLAALPEVEAVERVRPLRLLNQDAVWVHQSFVGPASQQTPVFAKGIFGCGQILGIADSGQDYDSCFFRDTVNGPPPISSCGAAPCPPAAPALNRRKDILYYNWSGTPNGDDDTCPTTIGAGGHGTHTSGSLAGDNAAYANCATFATPARNGGDGQAPGAKLVVQEMGDGLEYLNTKGGTVWNLADVAHATGVRIHSNSWGGACHDALGTCIPDCTIPYDSLARDADLAMWTHPDLLLVYAAGNAGELCEPPRSVNIPGNAKSVLTVGSVGHGVNANVPSSFTSLGPVFDGRLKPTLAAQGEATVSARSDANTASNNCNTCSNTGTSMSTPTAAGLAALAREYFTAGFYPSGTRTPTQGFTPSAALVKAALIDGAVALGAAAPEPDFTTGYGRVLLGSTLAFAGDPFKLRVDDHEGITTGSVVTHAYDVSAGTALRATLVWTDFPAALNAATARVNELILEVVDPSGNVWFQTLDPGEGAPARTSNPTDPHDAVNVEERLVFSAPAAGRWVVRVRGVDVPWGPQPFALIVRGALTDCLAPAAPGSPTLATPADHEVEVSWGAVSGAAGYNVYRSLGACPGGPWVRVATDVAGTSFLDSGVSGGATYSYYVAAASDSAASCESPRSPCASVVPTGDCTLDPSFAGLQSATSAGASSCAIDLSWSPGSAPCGPDVRYNVYRGKSGAFVPAPWNRIAGCLVGTSYTDSAGLLPGTTYHYVVRAEDGTTAHGGECRGGNEEDNLVHASVAPDGPPVVGTWADDAGDTGVAKFSPGGWTNPATGGNAGPKVYTVTSFEGACSDLTSPALTLDSPGSGPELSFATRHNLVFEPDGIFGGEGSVGQVEIANGPAFDDWTRVELSPDYPRFVDFTLINCTSTLDAMTFFADNFMTYQTYTASLVNWGGGEVKLRFHLSGDFLYPGGSWWIDDVAVTQAVVPGICSATPAGPPPVPDGAVVPGLPVRAAKSGGNVVVTWDATSCPATAINVYRGSLGSFSSFTAGDCGLPPTGSATLSLPDNVWFLVTATDGASTDGSWGQTPTGAERSYAGSSLACPPITQHATNNGCP